MAWTTSLKKGPVLKRLISPAASLILLSALLTACSQNPGPVLGIDAPRPPLSAGTDTADAQNYYRRGVELLRSDPVSAASHFQWASRLSPDWVDPLQGWRAALLLQNTRTLSQALSSSGRENAASRTADSLFYEGVVRAPLAYRQFDKEVWDAVLELLARETARAYGIGEDEARYELERSLRELAPEMRAWDHYVNRRWEDALIDYESALRRADEESKGRFHVERAHILGLSGRLNPAREEMAAALDEFRNVEQEDQELRPFYESKALYLHIMGALWEIEGDTQEAEQAYGQAAVEDLSFYPAHISLARLALEKGDTALAVSEYRLAADLRPGDPVLSFQYAQFLRARGEVDDAISQLEAAVAANPWWAPPYRSLGILHEEKEEHQEALDCYIDFLLRAPLNDPDRDWAEQKRALMASLIK